MGKGERGKGIRAGECGLGGAGSAFMDSIWERVWIEASKASRLRV